MASQWEGVERGLMARSIDSKLTNPLAVRSGERQVRSNEDGRWFGSAGASSPSLYRLGGLLLGDFDVYGNGRARLWSDSSSAARVLPRDSVERHAETFHRLPVTANWPRRSRPWRGRSTQGSWPSRKPRSANPHKNGPTSNGRLALVESHTSSRTGADYWTLNAGLAGAFDVGACVVRAPVRLVGFSGAPIVWQTRAYSCVLLTLGRFARHIWVSQLPIMSFKNLHRHPKCNI